jgi:hypothetical protein
MLSGGAGERIGRIPEPALAWNFRAPGLISDFAVATENGSILLSTIRDVDSADGSEKNGRFLVELDREGRLRFKRPLSVQTRVQAIRSDGALAYVSNYEHRLEAVESNGRVRWSVEASCRPLALDSARAVLCIEDDAAVPGPAFRVFDEDSGKLAFEYSAPPEGGEARPPEPLAFRKTTDGRYFVVGLTGARVVLFRAGRSTDGAIYIRALWARTVEGEITDVALAGSEHDRQLLAGEAPEVAVLHWEEDQQRASFFERTGLLHSKVKVVEPGPVQQIELSQEADRLWVQGNGPKGQFLDVYRREKRGPWSPTVRRHFPRAAEYSIPLISARQGAVAGVEENVAGRRRNHLVGLDREGAPVWRMPVQGGDGAYLYGQGIVPDGTQVAIATDDGRVSAYHLEKGAWAASGADNPK